MAFFPLRVPPCSPVSKPSLQADIHEDNLNVVDQKITLLIPPHLSDRNRIEKEARRKYFITLSSTVRSLEDLFHSLSSQEKKDLESLVENKDVLAKHLNLEAPSTARLNVAALRALLEIAEVLKNPLPTDHYQPKEEDKLGYHIMRNKVAILVGQTIDRGSLRKVNDATLVSSGHAMIRSKVSCDKIGAKHHETGKDYIAGTKEELEILKKIHEHFRKSHPGAHSCESRIMDEFDYTTHHFENKICSFGQKMFGNGNLLFKAPEIQKLNALIDIGIGLQTVADAGFIHYDFKLQNCLLDKDPTGYKPIVVKVIDFGLSCPVGTASSGTPDAEPPESAIDARIFKGRGYDKWSYAVAALEMMQESDNHIISNLMMDFLTLCKKEWSVQGETTQNKFMKNEIHRNSFMIKLEREFISEVKARAEFPDLIEEKFDIIKRLMRHHPHERISCISASNQFRALKIKYYREKKVPSSNPFSHNR